MFYFVWSYNYEINKICQRINIFYYYKMNIIGFLHIFIFGILISIYAFIFKQNYVFDLIYVMYIIFLLFSWIIYDNQCVITYYYNKFNKLNKINNKSDDVKEIIDTNNPFVKFSFVILTLSITYSIYVASVRSNIMSSNVTLLFLFIRFFYLFFYNAVGYNFKSTFSFLFSFKTYNNIVKTYNLKKVHYLMYPYVSKIIFIINLFILITTCYKNKNKILQYIK